MSEELRAAIVQDDSSGRVLMLGWMDEEALALTRSSGLVHFFSRSRQKLWQKGETSGNSMHVVEISHDCDDDAVLVRVSAEGPACHDGTTSCFTPWLWRKILQRDQDAPRGRTWWNYCVTGRDVWRERWEKRRSNWWSPR